jgi:hypothetical protein
MGQESLTPDNQVARMVITVLKREVKILKTTCGCCEYKWQRYDSNKSQNDPVFVYFIIFLAQIRRRSLDASLVNDSMTTLMKIVRGDFDPAFFHHHECLFHCYVAFAEVMMMLEGADAEKSFQVLVVALRKARYLWPGFRMMLCQHVKSIVDHFREEKTCAYLIRALLELDEYPPLREKCTYRSKVLNRASNEKEILQSSVEAKDKIRGKLGELGISPERFDTMLEEARNRMDEF